jgi:hypothetical protein
MQKIVFLLTIFLGEICLLNKLLKQCLLFNVITDKVIGQIVSLVLSS